MLIGTLNQAALDWPWSFIHVLSGLGVGIGLAWLWPTWTARRFWIIGIAILLLWEGVEITLRLLDVHFHDSIAPFKMAVRAFGFAPESLTNIIADVLVGSIGLWLGRWAVHRPKA